MADKGDLDHICACSVPIFMALKAEELEKIDRLIQKKDYAKKDILFLEGDPVDHLYIVRYGRIKLYEASRDGRQQILRILEPGDFFGELSLFNDLLHTLNAEALEDSGVCFLPKEDFKELIRQNPEMSLRIMQTMSGRLAYTEKFIGELTLKSIEERIASYLLGRAETKGVKTPRGVEISTNLTRHELANLLGTTQETLSRRLTKLKDEGIITTKGQKTIVILDEAKLTALISES